MIPLLSKGHNCNYYPFAHPFTHSRLGWWNDLDMIEIGNGKGARARGPGVLYPWAIDPAKAGKQDWTMTASGAVKSKGLCLTVGHTVELQACTANNPDQTWTLEANGNLHQTSKKSNCLALLRGRGPGTIMHTCKSGAPGARD